MYLEEFSDLLDEIDRKLKRAGEAALDSVEVDAIRDYLAGQDDHGPYDDESLEFALGFVRKRRRAGASSEAALVSGLVRVQGLMARAARESEQRARLPGLRKIIEQWRLSVFGSSAPPLSSAGSIPFLAVGDWIEEEARSLPPPESERPEALYYPGRRARAHIPIPVSCISDTTLGRLWTTANAVIGRVGCEQPAAVAYVMTDVPPFVSPISAERGPRRYDRGRFFSDGPILIRVNFDWVPADIVRDVYQRRRAPMRRMERTRASSVKAHALLEFLKDARGRGKSWKECFNDWNSANPDPDWRYESEGSFRTYGARLLKGA